MYRFRALRRRLIPRCALALAVLAALPGAERVRTADAQPAAPPPAAPTASTPPPGVARGIEWTSLRLLRDKGVLSEAEYESAMADLDRFAGNRDAATLVVSKLMATVYGFVQLDMAYNSTESCQESCSNAAIQKPGTYRGDHGRMVFSPRDSRFGIRFAAAEEHWIRTSALLETDFFGPTSTTEQGTLTAPVLRIRQADQN